MSPLLLGLGARTRHVMQPNANPTLAFFDLDLVTGVDLRCQGREKREQIGVANQKCRQAQQRTGASRWARAGLPAEHGEIVQRHAPDCKCGFCHFLT
jgi:hypothetical protein